MFDAEKFVADHQGTDVYEIIELAYKQGKADGHSEQLGTNLAEDGTDLISRQAAIDALHMDTSIIPFEKAREYADATISEIRNRLEKLPSAQPDIIRCRNCKFASGDSRICMKFGHSPIGELDFCAWAERRTDG